MQLPRVTNHWPVVKVANGPPSENNHVWLRLRQRICLWLVLADPLHSHYPLDSLNLTLMCTTLPGICAGRERLKARDRKRKEEEMNDFGGTHPRTTNHAVNTPGVCHAQPVLLLCVSCLIFHLLM